MAGTENAITHPESVERQKDVVDGNMESHQEDYFGNNSGCRQDEVQHDVKSMPSINKDQPPVTPVPIVIHVSPRLVEHEPPPPVVRRTDGSQVSGFFCPLCPNTFVSRVDSVTHLANHFNYFPIRCQYCNSKFTEMDKLSRHHLAEHPQIDDMKFKVLEDFAIEKYVDDFVKFQLTFDVAKLTLVDCTCRHFCSVCTHYLREDGNSFEVSAHSLCRIHDDSTFEDHVRQHFNYAPFACSLCNGNGSNSRLINLTTAAISHVFEKHGTMDEETVMQAIRSCEKVLPLPSMEQVIAHSIQQRQQFYAQADAQMQVEMRQPPPAHQQRSSNIVNANNLDTSQKFLIAMQQRNIQSQLRRQELLQDSPSQRQRMQQLQQQQMQQQNRPNFSNMRVVSERGRLVLRRIPRPKKAKTVAKTSSSSRRTHMRIQGGRVVNLSVFERRPSHSESVPEQRSSHPRQPPQLTHYKVSQTVLNSLNGQREQPLDNGLISQFLSGILRETTAMNLSPGQSLMVPRRQAHTRVTSHPPILTPGSNDIVTCSQCNESFTSKHSFLNHAIRHHPGFLNNH